MSYTNSGLNPTVAANPTAVQSATSLLAAMAALSGQATDYNKGSQIRTWSEAAGAVVEQQGVASEALAFQALAYGAMTLFGIGQPQATYATGGILFATSFPLSAAPAVPVGVTIPSGTIVNTPGGIQFITTVGGTLASGNASVLIPGICSVPGASGNIVASGISGSPLTSLGWSLVATNPLAMAGGANAGSQSVSLAQFTAKAASLGLCSPVAVANAAIGVLASSTGEAVAFAAAYEPWVAAGSGAGSGVAGFTLYIDNGSGAAGVPLQNAVIAWLNGSVTQNQTGYRPIGVPFTVAPVTPIYATVVVSGTVTPGTLASGAVANAATSGVTAYFNGLGFAPITAQQPQIAGAVADAGLGAFQSLSVTLAYSSASGTAVQVVSGGVGTRVILSSLIVNILPGS